jgi:hypothetical protein
MIGYSSVTCRRADAQDFRTGLGRERSRNGTDGTDGSIRFAKFELAKGGNGVPIIHHALTTEAAPVAKSASSALGACTSTKSASPFAPIANAAPVPIRAVVG